MSTAYVRTQVKTFLSTNFPTENVIDLTGKYETVEEIIADNGLTYTDNWMGLEFIGNLKEPISIPNTNSQGCERETGSIFLHVVEPAKSTAADSILTRATAIDAAFRGQRIDDIIVTSITPPNFQSGATLNFDAGYISASVIVAYYRDESI